MVADDFGREAEARAAGEQAVVGVFLEHLGRHRRAALVGRAGHDQLVHRLHVPLAVDEFHRQPVEQLGIARPFGLRPEVLRSLHEADAEEAFPGAVDPDAAGQRVFPVDEPAGEAQAVVRFAGGHRREGAEEGAFDLGADLVVFAAKEHEGVTRLRQFLHDHHRHRRGERGVVRLLGGGDLGGRLGAGMLGAVGEEFRQDLAVGGGELLGRLGEETARVLGGGVGLKREKFRVDR